MAPIDFMRYLPWQSGIDVVMVAFLLYQLYLWVRETRALRAVLGLAVLGVLSLFAHWAGLIMTGWLFQSLWSMGLLLIVIAFQPEIRRALQRMNPLDVLRGQRAVVQQETLAEIRRSSAWHGTRWGRWWCCPAARPSRRTSVKGFRSRPWSAGSCCAPSFSRHRAH